MAKVSRRTRFNAQPPKKVGATVLILQGVLVSISVSLVCVVSLALISLASENNSVENSLNYIMIGVTLISIFIGSVYATQKAQTMGLVIGVAVGAIYVLAALAIGIELTPDTLSLLVVANKLAAGMAAGALGGMVGVNL